MTFTFSEVIQTALFFANDLIPYLIWVLGIVFGAWVLLKIAGAIRRAL